MRPFSYLLFCIATFLSLQLRAQTTVSLGTLTGAGSTNVLLSTSTTSNKFSRTISIYTAAEINAAGGFPGNIISLAWDKQGTGEYTTGDAQLVVSMKHITKTDWGTTVPVWNTEIVGATQVFSSNTYSIPVGTGWKQVTFSTPFQWNGTDNIAVFVDWFRNSSLTAAINWGRSTTTNANAARVGGTLASLDPLLINSNRPLIQFTINPLPACAAPSTPNITAVGLNGATINWAAVAGATGYEYAVTTSATPPASGTATTSTSFAPTGLAQATTYYVHLRTQCGTGFSSWTTANFTTLTCATAGAPNITGVTHNSSSISWTAVSGAAGYEYAVTTSATPPASGTATTATSHAPGALNASTTYYAHVRTQCNATTYSAWTTASFTTLAPLCAAPAAPIITGVTYNSANVSWATVSGAIGYEYAVTTSSTPPASGTATTATSYAPNTLNGSTTYYAHIRTQCNASTYSAWTTANFTTPVPPCDAPAAPVVTGVTHNSANISWAPVTGAIGYQYAITTSAIPPASGTDITATSHNLNSLTPGTTHYVHIRTQCGATLFSSWATALFTTGFPPCQPTAGISINAVSANGANISWVAVPGALDYEYAVTTSAIPPVVGAVIATTTYSPNTLAASTTYYVHVRSRCAGSMYSSWVTNSFTTISCAAPGVPIINNIGYTTATISWAAVMSSQGYEYAVTNSAIPPVSGTATTATTYTATGLSGATIYYVHLRNKCAADNYSAWTTTMFKTSICGTVTPVPSSITFTTADFTWQAAPGSVGYEYTLSTIATPPVAGTPTHATSYNATNLAPNTTYYMHMRSMCETNVWSVWTTVSFNTLGCDKPAAPAVSNLTYTGADISWPAIAGVSGYEYAVTLNGYLPIITTTTGDTKIKASNLVMATTYNFHVRSICQGIYKSPWEVIVFRTKDHPTSVATANGEISIEAYPNPATDKLTVKLNGLTNTAGKLQLTDIAGRSLRMVPVTAAETTISLDGLASGIYMLQYIDANNSATTIRITKQ
jgi:hypothetical protein